MPSIANKLIITAAIAVLGASMSAAHACSMLADPNSPECRNGTGPVRVGNTLPSAPQVEPAPRTSADVPGRGQTVCAFFDTKTSRCLTVRPNTKAYDDAVQAGIDAAMMGTQIQQDAMQRAAEMGVLPGFPAASTLANKAPSRADRTLPDGRPEGDPNSRPQLPSAQNTYTPTAPTDSKLMSCVRAKAEKEHARNGRKLTPDEIQAFVDECYSQ